MNKPLCFVRLLQIQFRVIHYICSDGFDQIYLIFKRLMKRIIELKYSVTVLVKIHVRRSFAFLVIELERCTKEVLIFINHLNSLVICVWIIWKPAGGSDDQCVNYHYHSDIKNYTNPGSILHINCQYDEHVNSSTSASLETSGLINNTTSAPSGHAQSKAILLNGRNSLLKKKTPKKNTKINTLIYTHVGDFRCSRWNMSPWDSGMRQERAT